MSRLKSDVSRCGGTNASICSDCRRKEPGVGVHQWYMAPEEKDGDCDYKIEKEGCINNE
jgi:hypothetical protein